MTKPGHNFGVNASQPGTGHFTQLVWKDTTTVGMAKSSDGKFVVANYLPPGNFKGEYLDNVKPPGSAMGKAAPPPSNSKPSQPAPAQSSSSRPAQGSSEPSRPANGGDDERCFLAKCCDLFSGRGGDQRS